MEVQISGRKARPNRGKSQYRGLEESAHGLA